MKYEDLIKMSAKEFKSRLKDLNAQAATAKGEALDALLEEADVIDGILKDAQARQRLAGMAAAAGEGAEGAAGEGGEGSEDPKAKAKDARGKAIKDGKGVKFSAKAITKNVKALTSADTAMPVHTAADVNETFNDVSSLVDRVRNVTLEGGETYQRGFVKSYGDGAGATAEGADYNPSEPTFGYVTIKKEKVTVYTEEPEEMVKLPNADYDSVVEGSTTKAIRRYLSRQILIGDGSTSKFKGIFHNPTEAAEQVIDPATDITTITAIDDATLDEIIYSYGGDEEVEDVAVLILNKKDLKAFAKLRDKQGRKVYTIVNHGNTGTIDGVPYIINSACKAISDAATAAGDYSMAYGPLQNYEMAIFSDIDAKKSTDYKFKQGQIAYRADIFAGGAVAAYNGFVRVKKASA
ncbi:MAG: phage major capsid protein [Clostridia bacterium]|nr:phage major capsid protein [Clostridia bacterium]